MSRRDRAAGVSRVAVEVVILVIAVVAVLFWFSGAAGFVARLLSSWLFPGQTANVEIVSIRFNVTGAAGKGIRVYVRNNGPKPIDESDRGYPRWALVIDGYPCGTPWGFTQHCGSVVCSDFGGDRVLDVGEVGYMTFTGVSGQCLSVVYPGGFKLLTIRPGRQYRVSLYGPTPDIMTTTIYTASRGG